MPRLFSAAAIARKEGPSGLHLLVGSENAGKPAGNISGAVLILQRLKFLIVADLLDHLVLKFGPYFFAAIRGARPEIDHRLDRRDVTAALGPCVAGFLAALEFFLLVPALCGCSGQPGRAAYPPALACGPAFWPTLS
jgi:hypothetical protein